MMRLDWLDALTATDVVLIALSIALAVLASQVMLTLAERVVQTTGIAQRTWLAIGSVVMGATAIVGSLSPILVVADANGALIAPGAGGIAMALLLAAAALGPALLTLTWGRWTRATVAGALIGPALAIGHFSNLSAAGHDSLLALDPLIAGGLLAASALAAFGLTAVADRFAAGPPVRRGWLQTASALLVLGLFGGAFHVAQRLASSAPVAPGMGLRLTPQILVVASSALLVLIALVMVAANTDRRVRERRRETEALKRSEDRFRSLVQASAQIVWTTAPDGQMPAGQSSWSEFTGQDWNAYRGWGWFNAIHPDDRERTAAAWEETLANRRSVELEHRLRRYDGRYRDCVARVVPVLEPDGRVREWVGTHTDVTDRARMQQERDLLAGAGRVLSSSLDERETLGAIAGLIVPRVADWCTVDTRDEQGRLQRVAANHEDPRRAGLLAELGRDVESGPQERRVTRVLETGESELIREVTEELLREIAPEPGRRRALRDVGISSLMWVPLTARGQVLGVLTLARRGGNEPYDLRDLALAEELARRSAIAIDNARLYSASQGAIQARDEVLGIVSHDLRNPLSTISTTADLLLEIDPSCTPEDRKRYLQIVRRSAAAMNRLIKDLLDVSQSDNGSLSVNVHPADAAAIIDEVTESMRPLAEEKGQRLTSNVKKNLPPIRADAERIQQVLSNLIGNSIKFMKAGDLVHLDAREVPEGVCFTVRDTGPGVSREDLPHLFDRHWRAKETAHLGAGLGLAISKGIVEAHGGRIWAESEPGKGTQIRFVIPPAPPGREPAGESAGSDEAGLAVVDGPAG